MGTEEVRSPESDQKHAVRRYCVSPHFLLREIAGESVLVPVDESAGAGNCIIGLNETGSFIWKQYQTPSTPEDVVRAAQALYSDSSGRMEQEIHEYTKKFLQVGFLQEVV